MAIKLLFNADSLELYALRVCRVCTVYMYAYITKIDLQLNAGNSTTNTARKLSFRLS